MSAPAYAELSCQSAFSFLRGASEPETLVERAAALGYTALALTDRDGLYGNPRLHAAGRNAALPVIHGTTLTLQRAPERTYDGRPSGADDRLVLLAENDAGWRSLCRLVSAARHRDRRAPSTSLPQLIEERAGLIALAGPHLPERSLGMLREAFGRERLALSVHDRLLKRDRRGQAVQRERAERLSLPLVVTGAARFAERRDKVLHDVLACIRHRTTLEAAGTRLLPNAEFCLRPIERIAQLFRDLPDALAQSVEIARRCRFDLGDFAYQFPSFAVPEGETPFSTLHAAVQQGAAQRYRPMSPAASRQLAHELDIIERLDMAGYFLLVHDIVRFCQREAILCQGRGSAANSAVCYALGITSVDPVAGELLFERFLSEERGEMPDIDLDIAHQDRERVLQYVYEHYGRDRAAMAAEVICYRARSAVRDAAKALGFTPSEADALAKGVDRRFDGDAGEVPEAWRSFGAESASGAGTTGRAETPSRLTAADDTKRETDSHTRHDPRLALLWKVAQRLEGLPRHLSIHVGGMIITGAPLTEAMPVEPAAMPGRTVIPWDKDDLAALGILKIDLLGLGMLTVLDRCLASLEALRTAPGGLPPSAASGARSGANTAGDPAGGVPVGGQPFALHTVPADDTPTWDMLCAADTVGVFQVESRAQMNCLPRLRPRRFYDLVVEVALIRPGPIQGDMVHPYLRRRAGREAITYPHPKLQPILERTLGIPLFQEQGMRIAIEAAGFSPGEADELRRAMGHKRSRARMAALSERLVGGLVRNGIDRASAERILHQLSAFADYGFPESHAASFARLVWVSAWLKCHWPAPFLCALLNAQPMGFYAPAVLVSDAERHGVKVCAVDVTESRWESSLQWHETGSGPPQLAVRLGFHMVRGFGPAQEAAVRAGVASRDGSAPFADAGDVSRRLGLDTRQMEALARLGALRGLEKGRRSALWEVARLGRQLPGPLAEIFPPEERARLREMGAGEVVRENLAQGGASPEQHPMALLRAELTRAGVWTAAQLSTRPGGRAERRRVTASSAVTADAEVPEVPEGARGRVAGLAICRQRPPTAGGMCFVTLEDETGFANLVFTPQVVERSKASLHAPLMLALGRVERADGVTNLRVERLWALGRETFEGLQSHDYH